MIDARPRPAFAHASEAELARILDFYEVAWEYEPHTFPILYDREGVVLESFSPDFYLPDLDLYVEITTLKQRLVRKKNRKLRRLRELYPGIRIKLLYARDEVHVADFVEETMFAYRDFEPRAQIALRDYLVTL